MLAAIDWTEWAAITTGLVALATLGLAIATFRLVGVAKDEISVVAREAAATEKQAEITAKALVVQTRPWLTVFVSTEVAGVYLNPAAERNHQTGIEGYVAVKNAGQGLAVIPKDRSYVWGRDSDNRGFGKSAYVFPDSSILAPGETTALRFFVSGVPFETFVGSKVGWDYFVHALYTDADGGQPVVASFRVSAYPQHPASVFEIAYRHLNTVPPLPDAGILDSTEPFAIIRPGLPS